MQDLKYITNDWLQRILIFEEINYLQQEILHQTLTKISNPCEALAVAYRMLTEEQKIAFILAGGVPSLFRYQQHSIQQVRTGRDTETGQLPVLC